MEKGSNIYLNVNSEIRRESSITEGERRGMSKCLRFILLGPFSKVTFSIQSSSHSHLTSFSLPANSNGNENGKEALYVYTYIHIQHTYSNLTCNWDWELGLELGSGLGNESLEWRQ